ncbi:UNVERIFIED_CONTAM: hypothetical protein K2H54_011485 [Gekko kuhli]
MTVIHSCADPGTTLACCCAGGGQNITFQPGVPHHAFPSTNIKPVIMDISAVFYTQVNCSFQRNTFLAGVSNLTQAILKDDRYHHDYQREKSCFMQGHLINRSLSNLLSNFKSSY